MTVDEAKARLRQELPLQAGIDPRAGIFNRDDVRNVLDDHDRLEREAVTSKLKHREDAAQVVDLIHETAALRAELVATLRESVGQEATTFYGSKEGAFSLDGTGMAAKSLRRLAELGQVDIISDDGRRVVARWKAGT